MTVPPAVFRAAADLVVLVHAGFVVFVALGGLLAWRWRRAAWLHVPAVLWGAFVELWGWICPLTPLENLLRARGGGAAYTGDFVARCLVPALYPAGLTRATQLVIGAAVLAFNAAIYWFLWRRRKTWRDR